jgi:DNA-binding transcriptional MerR regulator
LRTSGNQRLYSERDIRKIIWLREQTALGLTISQAIRLMHSTTQPNTATAAATVIAATQSFEDVLSGKRADPLTHARRQLVEAFSRLDGQAAEYVQNEANLWASPEVVLVELLHGALIDIGNRPDLQPPGSAALHFARAYVQRKFASLFNVTDPNDGRGPIIAASVEGEEFDLTLLLSATQQTRAGFRIVYLGPNLPFDALLTAIKTIRPAVICLAATTETAASTLKDWKSRMTALKDPSGISFGSIPICFSGRIFLEQPQMRDTIDGHFLGHSAQDSVAVVESALADLNGRNA